jgi:hypothetical protein
VKKPTTILKRFLDNMFKSVVSSLVLVLCISTVQANPVRSLGLGATEDAALHHAFQRVIENKVGVLVLNELEINRDQISKDQIFNFSSAYVDKFEIVSKESRAGQVLVEVDVWVSESKLANRILHNNNSRTDIDGTRLKHQKETYIESKQQGDKLIVKALEHYPFRAFDIIVNNSNFNFDSRRQLHYNADLSVRWGKNFVDALYETLSRLEDTNQKNFKTTVLLARTANHNSLFNTASRRTFYFNDVVSNNILNTELNKRAPVVVVSFSSHGKLIKSQCFLLPQHDYFSPGRSNLDIKAYNPGKFNVSMNLGSVDLSSITDVKITVIGKDQCM